ncbi:cadherin domain-containing protein [Roseibium hamelinense]|uniref:cadherin domain-containing protein n=1 Tax=Roseibium hamelinense TaxID=150831 RepID=UPI001AD8CB5A|nr:cadherin domain-containing protein [Roseibium hamelinense]
MTATSDDGSTSTETFEIAITDANEFPIGPVSDSDTTGNVVDENGTGGEYTGVTAFADDPDVTDVVSYEITGGDDRFDIDPDTGEITVKDGVSFDYETETEADVEVTATSSDGTTSTGTFTVNIADVNEAPDLVVEYGDVGTNLIKNGSFESFDVDSGTWNQFAEDNSGAWTTNGNMEIWDNFNGVSATEGDQHLELDSEKNVNSISQTVETSLGQVYDLSFDVQARRDDDSNTVEVYWNGELVTSVDPEKGSWETVELQVVGTGGSDVLEFRETSEDNDTYGAFIDNVELTGTDRIAIVEETPGVEVVPLSVIDPDAGDTHTFSVSDDRFEVVAKDGKYVLKLKDDQELDYETETQVTLQVTATDQGGLSDTETIVIDVIDIVENTEPIGPVSDVDNASNSVMENAAAATVVGITAFATDADAGDSVTYSITDDRFDIDPETGVVTVADGAEIDRETTPTIDIEVTATSTDGSTSSKTFTIEVGDDTTEFSIGPVSDVDDAANQISETADGGEDTGLTAFAEDKDATDTVTYELSGDDRFEIDENTGVVTVKDGAEFDAETEPTVTVTVTATSTDGSSKSKDFDIDVQDGNEAPDLIVHLEDGSKEFIVNGSFELFSGTMSGTDGTGWYDTPDTIDGWTYQDVDIHQADRHGEGATDGDHRLDLTADDNGTISQEFDGMLDGQVYNLSFDLNSRGNTPGEGVAEVYWNGELIDTLDPTDLGADWQSYSFDIVGGSGDGTNTLTFVDKGSDNSHGVYIDSVSIKSDNRTAILEEFEGAEVAPLSVIDPDAGDTHTFKVSDDRFEVVEADGKYLLKLKDDQALDYETEQQVTVEVTATDSGGLSDTETIVIDVIDIDENTAPVGPVSDVDDAKNSVMENAAAATVVGITAFATDADAGDTVTYSVTDDRFEIDPDTGVITVADGADLDRETTPTIDVEVTATSTDGSTSSKTFTIEVGDDNTEFSIGPVTDKDDASNQISETADGGENTGITAFAEDQDATDTVTYELSGDDRFEIDENSGVITVKDGASFDAETEPTVTVAVTATSTDGSSSTKDFTLDVTDGNEAPDLSFDPELGPGVSVTLTFMEETAGYKNTIGVFQVDENGDPVSGEIVWVDHNTLNKGDSATVYLEGAKEADIGFFLIPDGASKNSGLQSGDQVTFEKDSDGNWQAVLEDGTKLEGRNANVFFSGDGSLNPDGFDQTFENGIEIGFEDIAGGGDKDFDDPVFTGETFGTAATAAVYEEELGADVGGLTVVDPDVGDTHTFTISDDRFEVVEQNGEYTLKLKDNEALDYETETQVTVQVTATDTGGLSDTETIVIDVIDIDDAPGSDIGPLRDSDAASNTITDKAVGGETVGITALADDPDLEDDVTYELAGDDRFEIDENTGVITVKDGASFDGDKETGVDLTVTANSTDGTSSTETFTVEITDGNEAPDLVVEYGDVGNNLIKNGSFETFDVADASFRQFEEDSSGAWTSSGKMEIWDNYQGVNATEGDQHLELDSENNVNSISQMVETSLGQVYDLSLDVQARTDDASNTVEIYWNGELVSSVDPVTGSWQTIELQVVGTGGNDVLEFRETSEDNNTFGAFIDNVELTGTDRLGVVEETPGAKVVPLSVVDPDIGDTHTFTVSDDRFEVVEANGEYLLKLKDDKALDYETETQVTLQVTATDEGGLSDTETIVIDVIDIEEVPGADVGPVSDIDGTKNSVMENAAAATVVGITAFATDADAGDTVTYSITDDRFEIDPDTGVITVADGADLDRETTPTIDVEVTATSTDGSTSSKTFTIEVGDDNTEFSIGPVADKDDASNQISETADGGENTGITAFAEDQDATDTVTYELSGDDRFEIDENSGVITVKDGASFDAETEQTVSVTVTATSTDGSTATKDFDIEITDGNEPPDLVVHLEDGSKQFVVNGSFEVFDGPLGGSDGTGFYQNPDSIEGWIYENVDVHQAGHLGFGATDGDHHLDLAALTNGEASQAIDGMMSGQVYELTFDMKSRGDIGQSVAEVYWNGELIETIDPAKTGSDWQTYTFDLIGGAGDGTDTLTFVEIGSDNNGGALIDSVSITSDSRIAVLEEFEGAEIAPLSVIDPDAGDTHTVTVSDDRFEVVEANGKYLLKLKDDQSLDYETEQQVTVQVTAADSGGLSDTETVVIDVIDIPEDVLNTDIGPVKDIDQSANMVLAGAAAGVVVGITAFADDVDAGDTVTYSITDERFEIDEETGVVTVAKWAELTPGDDISLEVTATSSDGSTSSKTFEIEVGPDNKPVVANDDAATVGLTTTSFYYSDDDGELHVISSDGSDTVIGSTGVGALTDVAIDSSGKLFGITFSRLYSVDPQTGEATKISSSKFGTSMNALEFAPDGTLYAASTNGKLYTVDVDTGKSTLVGEMEFESAGDLAFAGNKLYLSASDGSIVEIDPASGATVAVVATLPVSNAFGLVGDPAGQLYAFTSGGKVFQVDPETGSVSTPDNYVMNDSGWGATETADSDGQTGFVEGDVLANDVDPEGSMTVTGILFGGQEFATGTKIDSDYGSLTISADGSYTYVLDPDSAAAQALGVGTSDEEVFTYTVTDDGGNTDSATLTITVNGYADGAEVSAVDDEPVRLRAEGSDKDDDDILAKGTGDDEGDVESAAVATNDDDGQEGLEQTGTNEADTLEGGAGADALYGLDGNDILIGNEGADRLDGGAGNDLFKGGKGDDEMVGDDGNDMFAYAMGDGNDSISGGTGSWIDVIDLADGADGTPLGEYGADWTITVTEGSIETLADGSITLAENSDGYIELADGAKVDFSDVESVSY